MPFHPVTTDDITRFSCEPTPAKPYPGLVYAPYAIVRWGSYVLTTGNDSFIDGGQKKNTATITSFEFGLSPGDKGYGVDVEVFDSGGRMYKEIILSINKAMQELKNEWEKITFDFGWIIRSEFGPPEIISAADLNKTNFGGIFTGLDTEFSGGNVKIKFKLRAPQAKEIEASHSGVEGNEEQPMSLSRALRKIFTEQNGGGPFANVIFRKSDGTESNNGNGFWEVAGPHDEGPETTWPMKQNNIFFTANTWIQGYRTSEKKGVIILQDYKKNQVVIQSDPCGQACKNHVATFIINGGNNSPVISFNPSINWPRGFVPSGGGVSGGPSAADQSQTLESGPVEKEDVGTQTAISLPESYQNTVPPEQQPEMAKDAQKAHMDAANCNGLSIGGGKPGWTAELKIVGDPFFATILPEGVGGPNGPKKRGLFGCTMSIIFINPFYIGNDEESDFFPLEWLNDSAVNDIISNKSYLILGVSHQIQSGSYTTTFKLKLLQPNVEIAAGGNNSSSAAVAAGSKNGVGQAKPGEYTQTE